MELVDTTRKLYMMKIDGVPVGEQDGKLWAFYDEADHKEMSLWAIESVKEIKPAAEDNLDKST